MRMERLIVVVETMELVSAVCNKMAKRPAFADVATDFCTEKEAGASLMYSKDKDFLANARLVIYGYPRTVEGAVARSHASLFVEQTDEYSLDLFIDLCEALVTHTFTVCFRSFGYKYGAPVDAETVFDCRELPNPYWQIELREHNGTDQEVIDYLDGDPRVEAMAKRVEAYLEPYIEEVRNQGKCGCLVIDFGCTGGQHRSVYMAHRMAARFADAYSVIEYHRESKGRYR